MYSIKDILNENKEFSFIEIRSMYDCYILNLYPKNIEIEKTRNDFFKNPRVINILIDLNIDNINNWISQNKEALFIPNNIKNEILLKDCLFFINHEEAKKEFQRIIENYKANNIEVSDLKESSISAKVVYRYLKKLKTTNIEMYKILKKIEKESLKPFKNLYKQKNKKLNK